MHWHCNVYCVGSIQLQYKTKQYIVWVIMHCVVYKAMLLCTVVDGFLCNVIMHCSGSLNAMCRIMQCYYALQWVGYYAMLLCTIVDGLLCSAVELLCRCVSANHCPLPYLTCITVTTLIVIIITVVMIMMMRRIMTSLGHQMLCKRSLCLQYSKRFKCQKVSSSSIVPR